MRKTVRVLGWFLVVAGGCAGFVAALADASPAASAPPPARAEAVEPPARPLTYFKATVLGLVEGITEFLPISSTGHLILANKVLALEGSEQAVDAEGQPLWISPPDAAAGEPGRAFTVKAAADLYTIMIQAGAIAAVALLYWPSIRQILLGLAGRSPAGLRLTRNLLIAFFPAVILGLAVEDFIDKRLFNPGTVAAALLVGAVIMVAADRWQKRRCAAVPAGTPELVPAEMRPMQALTIGLMQCLSLWPGMSRSMATIVGGYVAGLRPARAAEFSFLLGLPTLAGAAAYKAAGHGDLVVAAFGWGPLLWGCAVAAVSAALAVHWLVAYLNRHGLALFAVYRIVLAVAVLLLLA
jgi:undecaprenyl-diphosphatase